MHPHLISSPLNSVEAKDIRPQPLLSSDWALRGEKPFQFHGETGHDGFECLIKHQETWWRPPEKHPLPLEKGKPPGIVGPQDGWSPISAVSADEGDGCSSISAICRGFQNWTPADKGAHLYSIFWNSECSTCMFSACMWASSFGFNSFQHQWTALLLVLISNQGFQFN